LDNQKHDFNIIVKEFENEICHVCGKPFKIHTPAEIVHCMRKSKTSTDDYFFRIQDDDEEKWPYYYELTTEKLKNELSKFGLSNNQSKLYIYLKQYGAKTAPEVCKALKIPRTEIYHLLTTLQNKGMVSATFQHPIKFSAEPLSRTMWTLIHKENERIRNLESEKTNLVKKKGRRKKTKKKTRSSK